MIEFSRELVAYSLLGGIGLIAIPLLLARHRRRKIEKLRRRGIKTFGH